MSKENYKKVLLILSTVSLNNNNKNIIDYFLLTLGKDFFNKNFIVKYTKDENSTKEYSKEFIEKYEKPLIIMAGGDGSFNEIVRENYKKNVIFTTIPNGTGNDTSRYFRENRSLKDIISNFHNMVIEPMDLIKINDKICVNITSFGFDGTIMEKAVKYKQKFKSKLFRKFSYTLAIFTSLPKIRSYKCEYEFIKTNGEKISGEGDFLINNICNGKYYGGGYKPAPSAKFNSGHIVLNRIKNISIFRLLKLIPSYKKGEHISEDCSETFEVVSGKIRSKDGIILGNIDGDLEKFEYIEFEIIPNAIKFANF